MSTLAPCRGVRLTAVSQRAEDPLVVERQLVDRARVDIDAFAELYRMYIDRVHRYAWRRTGSTEAAEDICAATFEAALRNLQRFRWQSGGFAPWLFRIASNQVVTYHRREGRPSSDRGQTAMAEMHRPLADDEIGRIGDDAELRIALARLSPRYQRAVDLRFLAGLSTEQAARATGMTNAAFSVVLSRGLKALRRELERIEQTTRELDVGQ